MNRESVASRPRPWPQTWVQFLSGLSSIEIKRALLRKAPASLRRSTCRSEDARGLGAAIGSDYYVLGDAQTLRRSPSVGPLYFESYASVFLVSSRTGRLLIVATAHLHCPHGVGAEKLLLADLSSGATRSRNLAAIRQAQHDERVRREIAIESGVP